MTSILVAWLVGTVLIVALAKFSGQLDCRSATNTILLLALVWPIGVAGIVVSSPYLLLMFLVDKVSEVLTDGDK